jgi:hypothetical protein
LIIGIDGDLQQDSEDISQATSTEPYMRHSIKNTPLWAKESESSSRRDALPLASSPSPLACP